MTDDRVVFTDENPSSRITRIIGGFDPFLARAYRFAKNWESFHKTKIVCAFLFKDSLQSAHPRDFDRSNTFAAAFGEYVLLFSRV